MTDDDRILLLTSAMHAALERVETLEKKLHTVAEKTRAIEERFEAQGLRQCYQCWRWDYPVSSEHCEHWTTHEGVGITREGRCADHT